MLHNPDTLASWLRAYPGVDVIARDRSTEYARGAADGAPHARQVLDRWHLLVNLREAVERVLNHHHARLQQLPLPPTLPAPPTSLRPQRFRPRTPGEQDRHDRSRHQRRARYNAVRRRVAAGLPLRAIARELKMSRTTVRLFAAAETFPERARPRPRASQLDPFLPYLHRRWLEGDTTGSQLWRDIRAQGYAGAQRHVLRWVQQQRHSPAASGTRPTALREPPSVASTSPLPAVRQLAWIVVRAPGDLDDDERTTLARVQQDATISKVYRLAHQFQRMVRTRQAQDLRTWFDACATSGVPALQSFAAGLEREEDALRRALTKRWSTGPVEGQITRLKCVKRQMYGRAGFDMLRRRVLRVA